MDTPDLRDPQRQLGRVGSPFGESPERPSPTHLDDDESIPWSVYPDQVQAPHPQSAHIEPSGDGYPPARPARPLRRGVRSIVIAVACGLAMIAAIGGAAFYQLGGHAQPVEEQPYDPDEMGEPEDHYGDSPATWYDADPDEAAGTVLVTSGGKPVTTGLIMGVDDGAATIIVAYHAVIGQPSLQAEQRDSTGVVRSPAEVVGFDVSRDLAALRVEQWTGGSSVARAVSIRGSYDPTIVTRVVNDGSAMETGGYFDSSCGSDYAEINVGAGERANPGAYLGIVRDLCGVTLHVETSDDGVVFDENAQAIGLVIRAIPTKGGQTDLYAVRIDEIRAFAATVAAGKDTGTVHVGPAGDLGFGMGWSRAAGRDYMVVGEVTPGGEAERAGIQQGDQLESIDGISMRQVQGAETGPEGVVRTLEPGSVVTVEWLSNTGGLKSARLTVGAAGE